jgi:ribosomal-protein-alanine N-acetyltransferase
MDDEIDTHRLHLRPFTTDDLNDLALIFSDPLVLKYLSPNRAVTREETNTALLSMISHWQRHGYGRWAVVHQETNELIGYGGLRCFDGTPELVYLLARKYWGCGLATELARGCLDYGFTRRGFERIVALTRPDNLASRRVMEKIGLSFERAAKFFEIDAVLYGITLDRYLSQSLAACASDSSGKLSSATLE